MDPTEELQNTEGIAQRAQDCLIQRLAGNKTPYKLHQSNLKIYSSWISIIPHNESKKVKTNPSLRIL